MAHQTGVHRAIRAGGVIAVAFVPFVSAPPAIRAQNATQSATSGTGVIAGRVVDGSTGAAIPGVSVTLSHQGPIPTGPSVGFDPAAPRMAPATQLSGVDGRFEFTGLPPGVFGLRAPTAAGVSSGFFGMQAPADSTGSNTRLSLRPDDRLTDLVFKLWRVGSISGRVTDERNEPVVRGTVHLLAREFVRGRAAWMRWRLPVQTDDRGQYLVANVPAGSYLVTLAGHRPEAVQTGYDPVFHPSARRAADATVITIDAGETRTGVDLTATFVTTADLVPVSGRVSGVVPLPPLLLQLVRTDVDDSLIDFESLTARVDTQGAFRFPRVPVGAYRLVTSVFPPLERGVARVGAASSFDGYGGGAVQSGGVVPLPAAPTWVLDRALTVDRPVENLEVALEAGGRIRGRLIFDDDSGPAPSPGALRSVLILVRPAEMRHLGDVPLGGVDPDGRFQTIGLPPGPYILSVRPPFSAAGTTTELLSWYVRSVRVGGRETIGEAIDLGATDLEGVELILTKRPMELSGTVRTADGRPAAWARVLLFSRDPAQWSHYLVFPAPRRIRQIVTDRFGGFRGAGVPPGEYQMVAVAAVPEFWTAPEYLQTLVGAAVPVSLQPGDTRVVELTLKQ
jgi:hypothetical protein